MVSALGRTYLLEANILKGADSAGNDKLERNGLVKPSSKLVSTLNDCQTVHHLAGEFAVGYFLVERAERSGCMRLVGSREWAQATSWRASGAPSPWSGSLGFCRLLQIGFVKSVDLLHCIGHARFLPCF